MPSSATPTIERKVRVRRWALGFLALGAVALGVPLSAAQFTSNSKNTASVAAAADWTGPSVDITSPLAGDAIRGTVTVTATASDAQSGIKNVALAYSLSGAMSWTTLCTDTTSPYSCSWNTAGLAEEDYDLMATATDNSNYVMTDFVEGVTIDNTSPTGTLNTIANPVSGTVQLTATADDATSGVASVAFQQKPALGTTWTTICADTESPYTCSFNSTTFGEGTSLDFRAVITDFAGNTLTTASQRRIVSNLASTVSVNDPGAFLTGTVVITANANATLGVNNVKIQRQLAPSGTWIDICTDTSTPYSCSFDTTLVANGNYNFRAILTDTLGATTTSAVVGPRTVDNSTVLGYDVQTTNGATVGKIVAGDTIAVTYTKAMSLTSILAGWDGTARAVVVRVRDGGVLGLTSVDDTLDVFTTTAYSTAVNLGSVNLKGNFIKGNKTAGLNATMVASTVTVNGVSATKITLTIGTAASGSGLRTAASTPVSMIWTPSALAKDLTNVAVSTAPVTELGTKDRDF